VSSQHPDPQHLSGDLTALCELVVERVLVEVPLEGPGIDDIAAVLAGREVEVLGEREGKPVVRDPDDGAQGTTVVGGDPGRASGGEGARRGEGDGRGAVSSPGCL
jgi:hypothetical protein